MKKVLKVIGWTLVAIIGIRALIDLIIMLMLVL